MVNIHNILLWLNAGMETSALMVNDILKMLFYTPAHTSVSRCRGWECSPKM